MAWRRRQAEARLAPRPLVQRAGTGTTLRLDSALPADVTAALREALAAERLDPSYEAFVLRHVAADDATWRWCCGSNCDPCVQRLGRVVDAARRALCTSGNTPDARNAVPGLPPRGGEA
jgi:hypothetical protein